MNKPKEKTYKAPIPKEPVKAFIKGLPCMYGHSVCRMIGNHPSQGKTTMIDGLLSHTNILIMTPHGTGMNPGTRFISEITKSGMIDLLDYDADLRNSKQKMYDGMLNEKDLFTITFD